MFFFKGGVGCWFEVNYQFVQPPKTEGMSMEGAAMATSLRAWETTVCYKWGVAHWGGRTLGAAWYLESFSTSFSAVRDTNGFNFLLLKMGTVISDSGAGEKL